MKIKILNTLIFFKGQLKTEVNNMDFVIQDT